MSSVYIGYDCPPGLWKLSLVCHHLTPNQLLMQISEPRVDRFNRHLTPNRYCVIILHLLGFIVCAAPLAVLDVLDLVTSIDPGHFKKVEPIFKTFIILHPLVDTIGFLIVYPGKFRQWRRSSRSVELRTVDTRRGRSGEIQVWHNPVTFEGLSRIAVVTGAVQG